MERISSETFLETHDEYDRAVAVTPGIASFTTSSHWAWAAHEHLHEPRDTHLYRESDNWLTLCAGPLVGYEKVLQPLEALWSFSCPLVGADVRSSIELLRSVLTQLRSEFPLLYLGGIPKESPMHAAIRQSLGGTYRVLAFPGCDCLQASLEDGVDGFLKRRSGKFRADLRRTERRATEAGLTIDWVTKSDDAETLFQRILAVEQTAWKWQNNESIFQGETGTFYRHMLTRALNKQQIRAVFVQHEGIDVAYAFGAVFAGKFRGLQMSYHHEYARYGLGNLVQWQLVQQSIREQLEWYDLGMIIDYKTRWSDRTLELANLFVVRNG